MGQCGGRPAPLAQSPFILLLASLLVFGCFPRLLTDKIQPSVSEKVLVTLPSR